MNKIKVITLIGALMFSGVTLADLNTGLVAYWNFNDCTATDISGNGHNGTIHGNLQCVTGIQENAFNFNGSDSYIEVSDSPKLSMTSAFSISSWVYTTGDFGDWTIVGKDYSYQNQLIYPSKVENSVFSSAWTQVNTTKKVLNSNKWNYVTITFDGLYQKTYVNGNLVLKKTLNSNINDSDTSLYIGSWGGWTEFFSGKIDDIRIYNRALSATEVQSLYYQFNPPIIKGSVPWVTSHIITCENITQNKKVTISSTKISDWDCEKSGLSIKSGDKVKVTIEGTKY